MSDPAAILARLAARLLPAPLAGWGEAMRRETAAIEDRRAALGFALGCLSGAVRTATAHHLLALFRSASIANASSPRDPAMTANPLHDPRAAVMACGVAATALGLVYLSLAGAPSAHLLVNAAALGMGLLTLALAATADRMGLRVGSGVAAVILGGALLLAAPFGTEAEGARRWLKIGAVMVQPSLIILPALILIFARSRDRLSTLGVSLAALALALQPDRAMAGVLTAGLAVLILFRRERLVLLALTVAAAGLAATLIRPDGLPAVPFVDRVFWTAFDVGLAAGLAVFAGAALLLAPALATRRDGSGAAVFATLWGGIVLAAVVGNYPTPLVAYGGSAILGYFLCALGLSPRAGETVPGAAVEGTPRPDVKGDARFEAARA